ncbi:MAG TPA: hypothetical protein PLD86_03990 [Vicinamibacteria bacterium]|nr:hypothetical protein [Vicinamibacteria bacterium]
MKIFLPMMLSLASVAYPMQAQTPQPPASSPLQGLASAASDDSAFPQLAADGKGGVFMTWLETLQGGAGHRLRLSHRKQGGAWEDPSTVHEGKDFWRNWADFPGLGVFADGAVMVHWLARSGAATYDYNIMARITKDGGRTWGEPFLVNTDGKKAEHGFVSFAATDKGMGVAWLDGRETKGMSHEGEHSPAGGGAMTLRFAEFLSDGTRARETRLDAKVCDCCQTAMVNTSKGLLAAYRDRSDAELRDISLVRPLAEKVEPREFSKDGWKINACPVNGPALASSGEAVTAVWFTMGGKARVRAAVSRDGGDTFSLPLDVDSAFPLGRVDVAALPSGESLLSWLGRGEGGSAEIKAAFIDPSGGLKPAFKVASTSTARASGFPRLERSGDEVVFAWTEVPPVAEGSTAPPLSRVRTAILSLK